MNITTIVNWFTDITLPHLLGIITIAVLLVVGVGPFDVELPVLTGLVGLAVPTTVAAAKVSATSSTTPTS